MFVAMIVVMTVADSIVRETIGSAPYPMQLLGLAQNTLLPLAITFVLLWYTDVRRRRAEARVDELLTNAIPRPIAARLRRGETRIADMYLETTILFADLVGFTPWARATDPGRVVALLDDLFSRFDILAVDNGVEKVKTIGDAYMAVAGAPEPRADHALVAVGMARAMLAETERWRVANGIELEARIGLASGYAVGGVIGQNRILFDLWGDTVNTAARMESSGIPSRIQAAESTWRLVSARWSFERREVEVKGLGMLSAYVLEG